MRVNCKTLWIPKVGNSTDEYEDAFSQAEHTSHGVPEETFRCAVADGATEASFAGIWAKLLTDGYVARKSLKESREAFASEIKDKDLSWFAEEKAGLGSFAAYVGLELASDGAWKAEAIGDCCLFHLRSDQIVSTFPILNSSEFNNSPRLVSSDSSAPEELPSVVGGRWTADDEFLLVSDALAKWMMQNTESGRSILKEIRALQSNAELEKFAGQQRDLVDASNRPSLRNDDVTIMRVQLGS